ncbi:MAG TPA: UDP-N-acetylmuramate--L-alanine ligase [Planctomycetota bacterium]|nr:UDP-N-acetylmuramate--L-alanine ligase [Planctomycetota bacterium]
MIAREFLDFSRPLRLHMLGAGGSGMTPLARLLHARGHRVSGADAREGKNVSMLRGLGIPVSTGEAADTLPPGIEGVIFTAAIPAGAAPLAEAHRREVPALKYARAVGLLSRQLETLAVAGTHGKTTTTAMLAFVLREAGLSPCCLVGGQVPQLEEGGAGGTGRLVVEACEYDRSFLHYAPNAAIVTNVEADHLDYFKDIFEIRAAFQAFAAQVSGLLVVHESLRDILGRASGVRARVLTYGPSPEADLRVTPVPPASFVAGGREFKLKVPGFHNALNASAVLLATRELGIPREVAARALERFEGVGRRLQVVGAPGGVSVIDDYAHHPTEVAAGLKALRDQYTPRRLWVVFQPHQYSRLRRFLPEFAEALARADRIVIPEVFAARDAEDDRRSVTPDDLVNEVRRRGGDAVFIPDFKGIVDFVRTQARPGDVVVTMGAGDVGDVAGRLAQAL